MREIIFFEVIKYFDENFTECLRYIEKQCFQISARRPLRDKT